MSPSYARISLSLRVSVVFTKDRMMTNVKRRAVGRHVVESATDGTTLDEAKMSDVSTNAASHGAESTRL